jgi:ribose/xylose/arabinose/galactoside ABC-type transport system permease subunit
VHERSATAALLALLAVAAGAGSLFVPRLLTAGNAEDLMAGFSFVAILAIGESFPILLRGVDLSIGAIVALAGMVIFDLVLIWHVPGWLVVPAALVAATLAGALNGVLIVVLRLAPFVATLATLGAYRGLVFAISGRQLVPGLSTTPIRDPWITGLETWFDVGGALGLTDTLRLPAIPLQFIVMLVLLALLQAMLRTTPFGRDVYAVGGNQEAARLAGIATGRVTIAAYAISGFCAGVAALLLVARLTTSTEALGAGMELTAIAAAVMGGVSLVGGVGGLIGPAIAAFLLGVVLIALTVLGVPQFVQQVLTGAILLAAISYDRLLLARRRARHGTAGAGGVA